MGVRFYSGNKKDHAVGIIAASKHQGLWKHKPSIKLAAKPTPEFQNYLAKMVGVDKARSDRGQQQFTGHTAVLMRSMGKVEFIRGFVPKHDLGSLFKSIVLGKGVEGNWQDDIDMLKDPAAISWEVPVEAIQAKKFPKWMAKCESRIKVYQLKKGDAGRPDTHRLPPCETT